MEVLHEFEFFINRREPNFDSACDSAYEYALEKFRNGYLITVWDRSTDFIKIVFQSLEMNVKYSRYGGISCTYTFKCTVFKIIERES